MSAPSSLSLLDLHEEDLPRLQRFLAEGHHVGEARSPYRHRAVLAQENVLAVDGMEPSHYLPRLLAHGSAT